MQIAGFLKEVTTGASILACTMLAACSGNNADAGRSSAAATNSAPPVVASVEPAHALVTVAASAPESKEFAERMVAARQAPGVLRVAVLSAQPGPEPTGFKSLAILDFKDESSLQQWMQTLGDPCMQVRQADVLVHDASDSADSAAPSSYFAVNHYEALVTPAEYKSYTEKYIVPNMAHQKSTGALLAYTMYLERAPAGTNPTAVLVKQYGSPEAQARGEAAKEVYKEEVLLKQPEWKQINDTKKTIRNDLTETFARMAN
ncbi:MAG: hypothetical protein AB7G76_03275 [Steroidobacteraceae bacterium]